MSTTQKQQAINTTLLNITVVCMYPSGRGPAYSGPITMRPFYSRPTELTQEGRSLVNDVRECVHDWRVRTSRHEQLVITVIMTLWHRKPYHSITCDISVILELFLGYRGPRRLLPFLPCDAVMNTIATTPRFWIHCMVQWGYSSHHTVLDVTHFTTCSTVSIIRLRVRSVGTSYFWIFIGWV